MSGLEDGNYIIYARVLSGTGQELAVTYKGAGNPLTLTPRNNSAEQTFTLKRYSTTTDQMVVRPRDDTSLEVAWAGNQTATPIKPDGTVYAWYMTASQDGYRIGDSIYKTNVWYIDSGTAGDHVVISTDQKNERYRWLVHRVV